MQNFVLALVGVHAELARFSFPRPSKKNGCENIFDLRLIEFRLIQCENNLNNSSNNLVEVFDILLFDIILPHWDAQGGFERVPGTKGCKK